MALLLNEPVIALQPALIRALNGDLVGAVVLQQFAYWMPKAESEYDGHFWVYKTYDDLSGETALTVDQVKKATLRMEKLGVLVSCQPEGQVRTKWYRIDFDHEIFHGADRHVEGADSHDASCRTAPCSTTTETTTESNTLSSPTASDDAGQGDDDFSDPGEFQPEAYELAEYLADKIAERIDDGSRPNVTKGWYKEMDLFLRRGPLGWKAAPPTPSQIKNCIDWVFQHEGSNGFSWGNNIRSPKKLREKYVDLRDQAKRELDSSRNSGHSSAPAKIDRTMAAIEEALGNEETE